MCLFFLYSTENISTLPSSWYLQHMAECPWNVTQVLAELLYFRFMLSPRTVDVVWLQGIRNNQHNLRTSWQTIWCQDDRGAGMVATAAASATDEDAGCLPVLMYWVGRGAAQSWWCMSEVCCREPGDQQHPSSRPWLFWGPPSQILLAPYKEWHTQVTTRHCHTNHTTKTSSAMLL